MSIKTTILTRPQLHAAWALAKHYGHTWANLAVCPDDAPDDYGTPLRFRDLVGRPLLAAAHEVSRASRDVANPELPLGICTFALEEDGIGPLDMHAWIFHVTSTGRLTWEIWDDGLVKLSVARNDGSRALMARVDAAGNRIKVLEIRVDDPCRIRHLEAAASAIEALAYELDEDIEPADRDTHAKEVAAEVFAPIRRSVALRDYQDLLDRVAALRDEARGIVEANAGLEDEALDCQLPNTWGLQALTSWAHEVAA